MGSLHDQLQIMAPYANNPKLLYRILCRISLNTSWDEGVPEKIKKQTGRGFVTFLQDGKGEIPKISGLSRSQKCHIQIYFDGSKSGIGVSVVVKSVLPNNEKIFRLLCNKSKLLGDDVHTAPRSELCACLVSSRMYCLIKEQLQTFLEQFTGKVSFQILGDSLIVLN